MEETSNTYIHHTPIINSSYTTAITKSMYISTTEAKVEIGRERERRAEFHANLCQPKK